MAIDNTPSQKPSAGAPVRPAKKAGLGQLIYQEVRLQPEREHLLRVALAEGLDFYRNYNESRLRLAFDSFAPDMRTALFELTFLLHVNDPSLSGIRYTAARTDFSAGVPQQIEVEASADLYLEDAPHGVRGLENLSPVMRTDFQSFVKKEFNRSPPPSSGMAETPVICLQSVGSIGTIGHKAGDSDLDLQVVFDLGRPGRPANEWSDRDFLDALAEEHGWWVEYFRKEQGLSPVEARRADLLHGLATDADLQLQMIYPKLSHYLLNNGGDYTADLANPSLKGLQQRLVEELMTLTIRNGELIKDAEEQRRESLFRQRLERIQTYITEKYPGAEIYLFPCPLAGYRAGQWASSLEFKESSGSAYGLLLNWETLLPGIHFTPPVPFHFLVPKWMNDDSEFYQRLWAYIRFQTLEMYRPHFANMIDLGNTPALDHDDVVAHRSAVYWEAFKASSGNLPKATLNLLRYEMLLEPHLQKSVVELIKEPEFLNGLVTPRSGDTRVDREALENDNTGVPAWALIEMEKEHPALLLDPWWLRYKALKVGFGEPRGVVGLVHSERAQISRMLDQAFALHVRISDVFTKPGDTRPMVSHREKVLLGFLDLAFPRGGGKRETLEHLFRGEMRAVNRFESDLRFHFRWALERAQKSIGHFDEDKLRRTNQEVQLWFNYYQENFDAPHNVVQKTIMHHLKIPRGRLLIGYRSGAGWSFQSYQKDSSFGKRFDTFGVLEHLPEKVTLVEGSSFLFCLVTCIVNGYYGILNPGTLKETRTAMEYESGQLNLDSQLDKETAAVRPDHIDRLLDRVLSFFPFHHHNYLDMLRVKRRLERVLFFLNLWKFGRLSILSRDNLGSWYCDDFDHPDLVQTAEALQKNALKLLAADSIHVTISHFLWDRGVKLEQLELAAWVNPNSVETTHGDPQSAEKEADLSRMFLAAIRKIAPTKGL